MKSATAMREIAKIAETQDGLVTTSQAVRVGVPRLSLARLAETGDAERLAHGVYRVRGADADRLTELRAAWLAVDPARTAAERAADLGHPIVVSHRSAAAVHGIGNMYADHHEMTAPVRKQSRRSDVIVHRADVPRSDIVIARGMLVTTIERTIADLARTEPELGDVADALADAYRRGAVNLEVLAPMLDAAARRHDSRDGAALLERMLELKGLDSRSALVELARQPDLSRLLGAAWAPAIQSAVEAAMRDAVGSLALSTGVVVDMRRIVAPLSDAINARGSMDGIARSLTSPAIEALTRDLGLHDQVARLARQALVGLPAGIVRNVARDE